MYYSYEMFQDSIVDLVEQINDNDYDYIIGLTRGGLIPAVHLSHKLGVPMLSLNWQTRDSNLRLIPDDIKKLINNKKILIVDDIIDSGLTFKNLIEELSKYCHAYEIACLIFNDDQEVQCDYFHIIIHRSVDHRWINFFWEK